MMQKSLNCYWRSLYMVHWCVGDVCCLSSWKLCSGSVSLWQLSPLSGRSISSTSVLPQLQSFSDAFSAWYTLDVNSASSFPQVLSPRQKMKKRHFSFSKGVPEKLSSRKSYCPIPCLFHNLSLLPTPVAVVGHGSNWNLIVPISSPSLFATT